LVEADPPVVGNVEPHLRATITNLAPRHGLESRRVSDLHHERPHAKVISIDFKPRKDHCMSAEAKVSRPELRRFYVRCVDHPLVCLHVQCRRRLKISHIRPMTKLSLCVASNDVQISCRLVPFRLLLFTTKKLDAHDKHHLVLGDRRRSFSEVVVPYEPILCIMLAENLGSIAHDQVDLTPDFVELVFAWHIISVHVLLEKFRVFLAKLVQLSNFVVHSVRECKFEKLFLVESALLTLF
jgi:hypothetical protein